MTSVVMMHVSILWTTCGVYTCLVTQLNARCLSLLLFFSNVFFSSSFCLFLPIVILPFLSFRSFWSLYCFVLLLCHSGHSQSINCYFFSLFLFLHFLRFPPPLLCLSMSLLSFWPEGPSLPLWLFLTVECARL